MVGVGTWAALAALLAVAACNLKPVEPERGLAERAMPATGEVAAPGVYRVEGLGFWDGRPALGGLWIAQPDAGRERRVLVTVTGQGRSAAATLYPNPTLDARFQVSSDLASVLEIEAGRPVALEVVALVPGRAGTPAPATQPRAPAAPQVAVPVPAPGARTDTQPGAPASVQAGVFAEQANAEAAAARIRAAGLEARVVSGGSRWRVLAVAAGSPAGLLAKVKELGFADAYAVAL